MTKREEMARAAYRGVVAPVEGLPPTWEEMTPTARSIWLRGVDAILAVLETPTEGMLRAAWSVRQADDLADATWTAMIRAIRDEATERERGT